MYTIVVRISPWRAPMSSVLSGCRLGESVQGMLHRQQYVALRAI